VAGEEVVMKEIRELAERVTADADAADRLLLNHATDPRAPFMLISTSDARALCRHAIAVLDALDARDRHLGQCQREAESTRQTEAYDEAEYQLTELRAAIARRLK
jgi:hypothetical protein